MSVSSKRTARVNVRISEDTFDRLRRIADELAMPPTTVAAFALSDWLYSKELQMNMVKDATAKAVEDIQRQLALEDQQN